MCSILRYVILKISDFLESTSEDYCVPILCSIRPWAPFTWQHIEKVIYIFCLIFFTYHLFLTNWNLVVIFIIPLRLFPQRLCSLFFPKVSHNLQIVRCKNFFWLQVYITWQCWVPPVETFYFSFYRITFFEFLDQFFSVRPIGSFSLICSLRVGVKRISCSFTFSLHTTQFVHAMAT